MSADDPAAVEIETHRDLGIAYLEMGLFDDAVQELETVRRLGGGEVFCLMMLGRCYLQMGRRFDAIAHLERALRLMLEDDSRRDQVVGDLAAAQLLPRQSR